VYRRVGEPYDRPSGVGAELARSGHEGQVSAYVLRHRLDLRSVVGLRSRAGDECEQGEMLERGRLECLLSENAVCRAQTHHVDAFASLACRLEREEDGGVGDDLGSTYRREDVVLIDARKDGVRAERLDRSKVEGYIAGGSLECRKYEASERPRVGAAGLDSPVALVLCQHIGQSPTGCSQAGQLE
jgi:hypothetical protein